MCDNPLIMREWIENRESYVDFVVRQVRQLMEEFGITDEDCSLVEDVRLEDLSVEIMAHGIDEHTHNRRFGLRAMTAYKSLIEKRKAMEQPSLF